MSNKVNPIAKQLEALKKKLFKGDYLLIEEKLNEDDIPITHNIVLNAYNGRLQNTQKLTQIKDATLKLIADRES